MTQITAEVDEKQVFNRLVKSMEPHQAIIKLPSEIKREFERKGITFFDRPGLYPHIPYRLTKERVGNWLVITIKQGTR